ncbi:MAG: cytochrome-c peroxidase [Candidatus Cloacimonadota bacterium]|nr:MAG: cytochrome-c peroxidase [Candidatus Cloacimonadota bacterium]
MKKKYFLLFIFTFLSFSGPIILRPPNIEDIKYPNNKAPSLNEIKLGKLLFFDTRLSKNKKQSCASCHNPDLGFSDGLSKGIGTHGNPLGRNTPSLYNLAWNNSFFWDGRAKSLEEQALGPIQNPAEMDMNLDDLIIRLESIPKYLELFQKAYTQTEITKENIASALASYQRTLIVNHSPFDQYKKGDINALSPAQKRGLLLFRKKALCIICHNGANFTDGSFRSLGIEDGDSGLAGFTKNEKDFGKFKVPGLRNISKSAPYMHDGSLRSLEEVIRFYNKGGGSAKHKDRLVRKLNLNESEIFDLISFLSSLNQDMKVKRPQLPKD